MPSSCCIHNSYQPSGMAKGQGLCSPVTFGGNHVAYPCDRHLHKEHKTKSKYFFYLSWSSQKLCMRAYLLENHTGPCASIYKRVPATIFLLFVILWTQVIVCNSNSYLQYCYNQIVIPLPSEISRGLHTQSLRFFSI